MAAWHGSCFKSSTVYLPADPGLPHLLLPSMRTGLFYLQTANRCELADLHCLGAIGALARATGNTIHQLQRERRLSNSIFRSIGA